MDLVVKAPRIPAVGETILGGEFLMVPGGKGANQAVASAKLGAEGYLVAKLGHDVFGEQSLANFAKEAIRTEYVTQTGEAPSGVALITVDAAGENVIVVAPGANGTLSPEDVEKAQPAIASSGALVAQLEVPLETVEFAARLANHSGVPFILDPAPARALSPELLEMVDVLTPNETEAQILTGVEVTDEDSARVAAKKLLACGVKAVVLTMGAKGFLLSDNQDTQFVPALKVNAVDTTAAGDAFTGALAVGLARGEALREAALFANHVAALAVMTMGAQSSMPTAEQVEGFIKFLLATKPRRH
ncbi:MAG: ribokinase [Planctomycetes bacterium RBG_16_55_9]|nr:MAG: ribokinase [Planctomycetes bacterium RBG_16_55_9]